MRTARGRYLTVGITFLWIAYCLLDYVDAVRRLEQKYKSTSVKISNNSVIQSLCNHINHDYKCNDTRKICVADSCPSGGIVTGFIGGRIGNYISTYASLWAISRHTGLDPYAPPCLLAPLSILFAKLSIPSITSVENCEQRWTKETYLRSWNNHTQAVILQKFDFRWDLIRRYLTPLRKELLLDPIFRKEAQFILSEIKKSTKITRIQVYVGVHIRRTDYDEHLEKTNRKPAPASFYINAIELFTKMFPRSLFIIVSDDPEWCRMAFERYQTYNKAVVILDSWYYLEGTNETISEKKAYVDLAVLAACNHTIYDYGTFGVWGAILAGGHVISYKSTSKEPNVWDGYFNHIHGGK